MHKTTSKEISRRDFENSTEPQTQIIKFQGTKIQCVIDADGKIMVALKPIIEAIGLHADSALKSIKNDPILGVNHAVRYVLDARNRKFPMQTLPIEHVHGWLFGIDIGKVKKEVQPKLIAFKKECYQVLFNHFYGKYQHYEVNLDEKRKLYSERNGLMEELKEIQKRLRAITKREKELDQAALTGQFQLAVKGGVANA